MRGVEYIIVSDLVYSLHTQQPLLSKAVRDTLSRPPWTRTHEQVEQVYLWNVDDHWVSPGACFGEFSLILDAQKRGGEQHRLHFHSNIYWEFNMKLLPVQRESLGTRLGVHILLHCLCRPYKIYGLVPTSKIIQFHCNVASAKLDGISGTYALPTPTPHVYDLNLRAQPRPRESDF